MCVHFKKVGPKKSKLEGKREGKQLPSQTVLENESSRKKLRKEKNEKRQCRKEWTWKVRKLKRHEE
jgi:hypothetical protein